MPCSLTGETVSPTSPQASQHSEARETALAVCSWKRQLGLAAVWRLRGGWKCVTCCPQGQFQLLSTVAEMGLRGLHSGEAAAGPVWPSGWEAGAEPRKLKADGLLLAADLAA